MNLNNYKNIYFIGIGGIGMSALARYFKLMGKTIAGYDKYETELTIELQNENIPVIYNESVNFIPHNFLNSKNTLIIYTPAIPAEHPQLNYFKENHFVIIKRAQALGLITENTQTIAVCGTHGKTTTSTLLAHLFKSAQKNITAFLGGISQNYNTNLLLGIPNQPEHRVIVEADEYDRSFLTLHPNTILCTSLDADHLDIYQTKESMLSSYYQFFSQIKTNGNFIYNQNLNPQKPRNANHFSYSLTDSTASAFAANIQIKNNHYVFNLVTPYGTIPDINFGYPGLHNIENAVGASIAALLNGLSLEEIKNGLETFKGVKRRYEIHLNTPQTVLIDDYAHHPTELEAFIHSVKTFYNNKKITGIFQPHLFTRTRDFGNEFAKALELLDEIYLLEIYPARELPIPGITSQWLAGKITNKPVKVLNEQELLQELKTNKPQVLLTIGAGNIYQLIPQIKQTLNE